MDEPARREEVSQARATLAVLRRLVLSAGAGAPREVRAVDGFGKQLDCGSYRRCPERD